MSTTGASPNWSREKKPRPRLRCSSSRRHLKSSRSARVVRRDCHGRDKPRISEYILAMKHAAPGGIVITARCMRPATCCRSRRVRVRRVSNSRSIATYSCCLRSLNVRVRFTESHQKPKASCTCAAALSLISLM